MEVVVLETIPAGKGNAAMPGTGRLVRGRERTRLKKLLEAIVRIETRDQNIAFEFDPTVFKGQMVFFDPDNPAISPAVAMVKERVQGLLNARV